MKLIATLPNGQTVSIEGPIRIDAFEDFVDGTPGKAGNCRATYAVEIQADLGAGVSSSASGPGHASVSTRFNGVSLRIDVKPA